MDYKHILVATDFSDIGNLACHKAAALARLTGARLTLLHVIEFYPEDRSENSIPPENIDPKAFFIQQAEKELKTLRDTLDVNDVTLATEFTDKSASWEIVYYAGQNAVDLIVTGTHGTQGMLERLGSTANHVLHDAKVDVFVVRANG